MPAQARLEARSTMDDAGFTNGIENMRKRAQSLSSQVTNLFKRDRSQRAEHILSGFITDLTSGNIPAAIEGITTRLSGLGLAAGVGLGVGSAFLVKFVKDINAVSDAREKLEKEMTKPLALVANLGADGIIAEINRVDKALETLNEKRKTISSRIMSSLATTFLPEGDESEESTLKAQKELISLSHVLAQSEGEVVEARRIGLEVSDLAGDRLKAEIAGRERIAKLLTEKVPGQTPEDLAARIKATEKDTQLTIDALEHQAAIKARTLADETKLAGMASSGVSVEQIRLAGMRARLDSIQSELQANKQLTEEKRAQLALEAAQTQAQIDQEKRALRMAQLEKIGLTVKSLAETAKPETVKGAGLTRNTGEEYTYQREGDPNKMSAQAIYNARQARLVEEAMARADALMRDQADVGGAFKASREAEGLKSTISTLKPSEREPSTGFGEALENSARLKSIDEGIQKIDLSYL